MTELHSDVCHARTRETGKREPHCNCAELAKQAAPKPPPATPSKRTFTEFEALERVLYLRRLLSSLRRAGEDAGMVGVPDSIDEEVANLVMTVSIELEHAIGDALTVLAPGAPVDAVAEQATKLCDASSAAIRSRVRQVGEWLAFHFPVRTPSSGLPA